MEINRLLSDELTYELLIRGAVTEGTVEDKRQRLRMFIRLERLGSLPTVSAVLVDPGSEIEICHRKVVELDEALEAFDHSNAANEHARLQTRLSHVLGRLNRIADARFTQDRTVLTTRCAELLNSLEDLVRRPGQGGNLAAADQQQEDGSTDLANQGWFINQEPQVSLIDLPNEALNLVEPQNNYQALSRLSAPAPQPEVVAAPPSFANQQASEEPFSQRGLYSVPNHVTFRPPVLTTSSIPQRSPTVNVPRYQPVNSSLMGQYDNSRLHSSFVGDGHRLSRFSDVSRPLGSSAAPFGSADLSRNFGTISKWNLRFSGQGSVTTFIERAEELAGACGLSHCQLFQGAIVFFTDMALSWFRSVRDSIHSWEELKAKLKLTYLSPEYEDDIWNDIRNRTQGPNERTAIFCAQMRNLFRKLSQRPTEELQLRIIRRNLLPEIQTQLALQSFTSVAELEAAAQSLENVRTRVQRMRPPPSNPNMVTEPECMYQRPRNAQLHVATPVVSDSLSVHPNRANSGSNPLSRLTCWNCRELGHLKRDCTRPLQPHCFRCGRQNVTLRTCPRCSGTGNGSANH